MRLRSACLAMALALCALGTPTLAAPPPLDQRQDLRPAARVEQAPDRFAVDLCVAPVELAELVCIEEAPAAGILEIVPLDHSVALEEAPATASSAAYLAPVPDLQRLPAFAESVVVPLDVSPTMPESAVSSSLTRPPALDCNGNCGGCNAVEILVEPALLVDANCGACDYNGDDCNNGGSVAPGSEGRPLLCHRTSG